MPSSDVDSLSRAQHHQRVVEWNDSRRDYPEGALQQLFEARVGATPDAVAVVSSDQYLSYAELDRQAGRLAEHLGALEVRAEIAVGICLDSGLELPVATLAVLKAGGFWVPLDPAYPNQRLRFMARDAGVSVLLTRRRLSGSWSSGIAKLYLEPGWQNRPILDGVDGRTGLSDQHNFDPNNVAYVIYTSGTTGRPKGVAVSHQAVVNRLLWSQEALPLSPSDRVLQQASASFDFSVWEFFAPWVAGAPVIMVPADRRRDASQLADLLIVGGITVAHFVPSLLAEVLAGLQPGTKRLGWLRRLFSGGEALSPTLRDRVLSALDVELVNQYGPTEATIDATFAPCRRGDDRSHGSIGRPIANSCAHVLSSDLRQLPPGRRGEIHVGGALLARGYLERAGLTAARFVPDPWVSRPGGRLYRTGDLARYLADGALEFVGRLDHQVKIRGLRVEPGEIESLLEQHPDVHRAAVLAMRSLSTESGDTGDVGSRLVACVVLVRLPRRSEGFAKTEPAVEPLRAWLRDRLPDFMVPTNILFLDVLPWTPVGKIDRQQLEHHARRHLASLHRADRASYTAPRNPHEEILAEIWSEVLGVVPISVHDHFLELGGHSLVAARVAARIRQTLGLELTVGQVFEWPTIAAMARELTPARFGVFRRAPEADFKPEVRPDRLPLSFGQERLWFLHRLEPRSPAYNLPFAWRLAGALDVGALERSLYEIVRRHEVLRTCFPSTGGEPWQEISPQANLKLATVDISHLPLERQEALARSLTGAEALRPFDLERRPLLRTTLLRLASLDHVLLLTLHHMISDGRSHGVLYRELTALYEAYTAPQSSSEAVLPELAVQYVDVALRQRRRLREGALEPLMSYWRRELEGRPAALELPMDRPRPLRPNNSGVSHRWTLDRELVTAVRRVGAAAGASLYMTLLAAWTTFLHRLTQGRQILIGSPVSGRDSEAIDNLIGLFVNTLVMRASFDGELCFDEHLAQVRATALGAYDHQDLPFEKLVEDLQPERDIGRNPLFQVTLVVQQGGALSEPRLAGLEIRPFEIGVSDPARFDLALYLREEEGTLEGTMVGLRDIFDPSTIVRWCTHFEILLGEIAIHPDQRIASLSTLTGAQRHQLLVEWAGYPEGENREFLHRLVEIRAMRVPEAVALVFRGQRLSYRWLDRQAERYAHALLNCGFPGNGVVGICLQRSPRLVAAVLGVLKSGGAYLFLDPVHPSTRRRDLLTAAGGRWLVTTASWSGDFESWSGFVMRLDEGLECVSSAACLGIPRPSVQVSSRNPAYVTYTSGTTGRAKGVVTSHRAATTYLDFIVRTFGLGPTDIVLQIASLAFDRAVRDLFAPLAAGAMVVISDADAGGPEGILCDVKAQRVTCVPTMVPSLLRQLSVLDSAEPRGRSTHVRCLLFAGEKLTWADRQRASILFGGQLRQANLYGPTEGTCTATSEILPEASETAAVAIGRPHEHVSVYLLDQAFNPAVTGAAGELTLSGKSLATGYQDNAGGTARVFVPSPVGRKPGDRLYRTGDLARYRSDGRLELLGRIDHQLKIRGFRVEPGEVEAALDAHPVVNGAAVVGRVDSAGDWRLIAYVQTSEPPARTLRSELRCHLHRLLPAHLVPSLFVFLEALPLTTTGKVDRVVLSRRREHIQTAEDSASPRDPIEEILVGIWCELLEIPQIGVHDDFFEIGGHSLLATRVVSRIRRVLGVELPVRRLFERPTVAELAGDVAAARQDTVLLAPPLEIQPRPREVPLSFAQERLWVLDQLEPMSAAYNMASGWRLQGRLDIDALTHALRTIVRRHEVLRTCFQVVDDRPCQVISARPSFDWRLVDLGGLTDRSMRAEARKLAADDAARPFDLAEGPLFRATLARFDDERHLLMLTLHHIVSDAWSQANLIRELEIFYRTQLDSHLPELPVQYADYALWQRRWLHGQMLDGHLAFWRQQLDGLITLELPTDRARSASRPSVGGVIPLGFPKGLTRKLRELSMANGTTLFMSLLAAFATLLSRLSGQRDVAIGSPLADRGRAELEPLIGNFTNTLVLRTDLSSRADETLSFRQLLERVRSTALEAFAHQEMPFERLVEALRPARGLSSSPLFQVMFVLHNGPSQPLQLPRIRCEPIGSARPIPKFDLSLSLRELSSGLSGEFVYRADLFDATRIQRLALYLKNLLGAALERSDRPLSELPLLSEVERQQVVIEWNDTRREGGEHGCLHQLLEAQVASTPERIALAFDEQRLSYRWLDLHATGLARILTRLGVGPGDIVPALVRPGLEVPIALLAIMKSGAAYTPLDTRWPRRRIRQALDDLDAKITLVDEVSLAAFEDNLTRYRLLIVGCSQGSFQAVHSEGKPLPPHRASQVRPRDPIYAIYTSGSTGKPKAALNTHRGVVNRLRWMDRSFGRTGDRVVLQTTHHTFDSSVWQFFWPLVHGALSVLPVSSDGLDLEGWLDLIERERVSFTDFVPSVFDVLVERLEHGPRERRRLAVLRHLILGGEAIQARAIDRFRRFFANVEVTNLYGPTETAIGVVSQRLPERFMQPQPSSDRSASVPIGRPIDNTTALILGSDLVPVPVGVPGEIYLGGVCVGLGYLGDPERTAQAFIANPFQGIRGSKLYKTGDLARYRADGRIEFLGRTDDQVKIRGFRVEPVEIEKVLVRHPAVEAAAVVLLQDSPRSPGARDRRLVAYLAPSREERRPSPISLCEADLRDFLERRLPRYMVPSELILLEALPLTPSGKVDRSALSRGNEPAVRVIGLKSNAPVPPRNAVEEQLMTIWSELLGRQRIGIRDDFFAAGGHSLLAVSLMSRIERHFEIRLPLSTLFGQPTIEGLASRIVRDGASARESPLVPIQAILPRSRDSSTVEGWSPTLPLFAVHPVGGQVLCYYDLAKHLDADQPFYGLQAAGAGDTRPFDSTIGDMAERYLKSIRSVQPLGPYRLSGWSMGGVVAVEIAQRLRSEGEEIEALILIDTSVPGFEHTDTKNDLNSRLDAFSKTLGLAQVGRMVSSELDSCLLSILETGRQTGILSADVDLERLRALYRLFENNLRALRAYIPSSYPGKITLLRASQRPENQEATLGWNLIAEGGVEVCIIPGDHYTLLREPNVRLLADRLTANLQGAMARV